MIPSKEESIDTIIPYRGFGSVNLILYEEIIEPEYNMSRRVSMSY